MERAHTKTKFILITKKENKNKCKQKKKLKHLVNEEPSNGPGKIRNSGHRIMCAHP